jgi:3-hydroxybutyryl-CoA dehydrogenase
VKGSGSKWIFFGGGGAMTLGKSGFSRIGVVGAGQMGAGIAQVCAQVGFPVTVTDVTPEALVKAKATVQKSMAKLVEKGMLTPSLQEQALGLMAYETQLEALARCDLVIEAVSENLDLKGRILRQLDGLIPVHGVIATNTSSISIARLAGLTQRPDRVIGIHFMNPVPLMKLVEIIVGLKTSQDTLNKALEFCRVLGKETIQSLDYPGFVVNRILMPMINEAFEALREGLATADDIDRGMKLGTNQPMGPIALADFIGLDTCLSILEVLYQGFGNPKYYPSPLLRKYVEAGLLGRKTKQGVYKYE